MKTVHYPPARGLALLPDALSSSAESRNAYTVVTKPKRKFLSRGGGLRQRSEDEDDEIDEECLRGAGERGNMREVRKEITHENLARTD